MSSPLGINRTRDIWEVLINVEARRTGPFAFRHAPLLALGHLGEAAVPMSSQLYPSGLRAHLLRTFGLSSTHSLLDNENPGFGDRSEPFQELSRDLHRYSRLSTLRKAQVCAALNCLTHQPIVKKLASIDGQPEQGPHGMHLLYEIARAEIRVDPRSSSAREKFDLIVKNQDLRFTAINAAIQLGALEIRTYDDVAAAEAAVASVATPQRELEQADPDLPSLLALSRLYRLIALIELKKRNIGAAREALRECMTHAEAMMARTSGEDGYGRLLAEENHKIVVEVHFKAAAGGRDLDGVNKWGRKLLEIDNEDPYVWQHMFEYSMRMGAIEPAVAALTGFTATGGLGVELATRELLQSKGAAEDFQAQFVQQLYARNPFVDDRSAAGLKATI
ncbi:hypothetical protein [Glycomyces buryatensis]|uniref:Tetratricopeptide repeat protein n=1 Tax=Glycomyces buryatensis TaxID=2570927 RepID=A0A4S8Q7F7_9ACTN|nr:hypothetical protein [Glycomyces buryatensis]THV38652.1 hypothetical protein FAB82_19680 [Glycomyces buryatensis]